MEKNKMSKQIFVSEYVLINGIEQFLFHEGTSSDNPVMLFLHGGPGSVESLFTRSFQEKWEDIYTVVHWDQRGAGKTLMKNPDKLPTIELMLEDLYEAIQYLKKKYNKQKIVLIGHSWGTVLGTTFIRKYPEEVAYYIGMGQVVDMLENEQVGYDKVRELILKAGDTKSLNKLNSIGEYPGSRISFDKEFLKKCGKLRKLQGKYKLGAKIDIAIFLAVFKSPIFRLSDIAAFIKLKSANEKVYPYLGAFNLHTESPEYKLPIYYILGRNDWQAPHSIAENYFSEIIAPNKNIYVIPNAGHMVMMEQPQLCFEAIADIYNKEETSLAQ